MNKWKYQRVKKRTYLMAEALVAIAILTGVLALFSKNLMRYKSIEKSLQQIELLAREEACIAAAKQWLKQMHPQPLSLFADGGLETELEIKGPLISQGKLGSVTQKVRVRISLARQPVALNEDQKSSSQSLIERALLCVQIDGALKRKSPTFEVAVKN